MYRGFTTEKPNQRPIVYNVAGGLNLTSVTSTSAADSKYLVAWLYHSSYDTNISLYEILNSVQIELGSNATEYEEYYETYEDGDLVENITLAVYRREYDGNYKEIASCIPNNYTAVTDPHPA